VDDASKAFWRRIVVIQFTNEFSVDKGTADTDLAATIIATEMPGVVLWALEGAARLLSRGSRGTYTIPQSHHAALAEWRLRADQVAEFLSEMTTPTTVTAMRTPGRLLYDTYVAWAKRDGHRPLAGNNFGIRVKALGTPWAKPDKQILYGVALTPEANHIREAANRRGGPEYRPDPVIPTFRRGEDGNPSVIAPVPARPALPTPPYPPGPPGFRNDGGNGANGNFPQG
jgi:phage/plasmid-associated DNA primase